MAGLTAAQTEAFARQCLARAESIRRAPKSEFAGKSSFLAGSIQEGMAKGFEEYAYRLAPHLKPPVGNHPIVSLFHRLTGLFGVRGNHPKTEQAPEHPAQAGPTHSTPGVVGPSIPEDTTNV